MERTMSTQWNFGAALNATVSRVKAHSPAQPRPAKGMAVSFKTGASETLAGIPARVTDIWPRLASGDYLVTLEYSQPVKFRNSFITHIEAFMSDLEPSHSAA